MSRLGEPHCPACDVPIGTQSADEIIAKIMDHPAGTKLYSWPRWEVHVGETLRDAVGGDASVGLRAGARRRADLSGRRAAAIDRRRKHDVEVVIDRVTIRPDARSRIAGSVENALSLGRGVLRVAYPRDDVPEPHWTTVVHSQHFACDRCGRSFEPLSPHNFSFNSPLGWCPACEGLGMQTGTNPAVLLRDPKLTLAQGAVALWPDVRSADVPR